jgi:DNA-binding transcriptional ArsR family regulator
MSAKVPNSIKDRRRISDETSRAMRQDARAGKTVEELMEKYSVGRNTVRRHVFAFRKEKLTEFQLRDIRKMYKEGAKKKDLAVSFGLSIEKIRSICARLNGCQIR